MEQSTKWFIIIKNHKIKYFILQLRERYVKVNLSDSFKLYRCSFSVFRHFAMSFRTKKLKMWRDAFEGVLMYNYYDRISLFGAGMDMFRTGMEYMKNKKDRFIANFS